MIKNGRHSIRRHTTLEYVFTGARIDKRRISPTEWELSVDLATPTKKGKVAINDIVAYQKIQFWLDMNLSNIVFANVLENDDLCIANMLGNIAMYCPAQPNNYTIICLLHAKLRALSGNRLIIGEMRLRSRDSTLNYVFNSIPGEQVLPSTTKEFYKEGTCRDLIPWWDRDDGFCFEFIAPDGMDASTNDMFQNIIDPMTQFWKVVNEIEEDIIPQEEEGEIVQVEKWKPKII